MSARKSLSSLNAGCEYVPLGLLVALGLLIAGLVLPVMRVKKLVFWKDDYSILSGVASLFRDGSWFLGLVIVTFSVVFPIVKLAGLLWVWFTPLADERRARAVRVIDLLGRWSMLDVFVVAVMIVIASSKSTLDASPRSGLYVFAAAVGLSMVMTMVVEKMLKRGVGTGR